MIPLERKSIGMCILLSVVTCGIYTIYWEYCILRDSYLQRNLPDEAIKDILLSIVTCGIYGIYRLYKLGKEIGEIRQINGLEYTDNSLLYILLTILGFGIIVIAMVQNEYNVIVDTRNNYPHPGADF